MKILGITVDTGVNFGRLIDRAIAKARVVIVKMHPLLKRGTRSP